MIIKRKIFAGYAETPISSVSYHSGQILGNYVLNPVDKAVDKVDDIPVVKDSKIVKRKVDRVKGIVKPLKKLLRNRAINKNE